MRLRPKRNPGNLDRAELGGEILAARDDELRKRCTQDTLIAVVDELKGFLRAITSVFPKPSRPAAGIGSVYSLHFASSKEDRRSIYQTAAERERRGDLTAVPVANIQRSPKARGRL
jgi:transposase-like protein